MKLIFTDLESDDLLALVHLFKNAETLNERIVIVVGQSNINQQMQKVKTVLNLLGKTNVTVLPGSSSDDLAGFNQEALRNTRDVIVDLMQTEPYVTILALKPIYDLLAVLSALPAQALSHIEKIHLYGSFNLRDITSNLENITKINPFTPSTLDEINKTLAQVDGKINLYERTTTLNDRDAIIDIQTSPKLNPCLQQPNNALAEFLLSQIQAWNKKPLRLLSTNLKKYRH